MKPARSGVTKTWRDVPTVGIAAFGEARQWIESFLNGRIDPQEVQRKLEKAKALMNKRQNAKKSRPSRLLDMQADATVVRRQSGLLVPPKYGDAPNDDAVENLVL